MIKNKGRVAPCQNEWNEFRDCHANTRADRLNLSDNVMHKFRDVSTKQIFLMPSKRLLFLPQLQ